MRDNDTIVAIATPVGVGSVGVVRLSGTESLTIAQKLWRPVTKDEKRHSHRVSLGWVVRKGIKIDQALLIYMKGPHSYTGEDVIEIQAHGSQVVLNQIVDLAIAAGARLAEPGEFTKRAYLNGKIDLVQAEAVGELISSTNQKMTELASQQLAGSVSTKTDQLAQEIARIAARESANLDFSEEDLGGTDPEQLKRELSEIKHGIQRLLEGEDQLCVIRDGFKVALVGLPNAGKSSLLNYLLGHDRSIVTSQAGTTRDTIEEAITIQGLLVRLVDTAGLRSGAGKVEAIGVERAIKELQTAGLILLLVEPGKLAATDKLMRDMGMSSKDLRGKVVVVHTKSDKHHSSGKLQKSIDDLPSLVISTKTGEGVEQLKETIYKQGVHQTSQISTQLTTKRQYEVLHRALDGVEDAVQAAASAMPTDIIVAALQQSLDDLLSLNGKQASEETIAAIFSGFCIGK